MANKLANLTSLVNEYIDDLFMVIYRLLAVIIAFFVNISRRTSLEDIEDEEEIEEYESEDNTDIEKKVKRLPGALKVISAQALLIMPLHFSSL